MTEDERAYSMGCVAVLSASGCGGRRRLDRHCVDTSLQPGMGGEVWLSPSSIRRRALRHGHNQGII
jgi:hypothetical protein